MGVSSLTSIVQGTTGSKETIPIPRFMVECNPLGSGPTCVTRTCDRKNFREITSNLACNGNIHVHSRLYTFFSLLSFILNAILCGNMGPWENKRGESDSKP